jgi:tetratricopeptide (TPR) repeat protein
MGACASVKITNDQKAVRRFVEQRNYSRALDVLKKSEIAKNDNTKLLLQMEKGRIHMLWGDYKEAAKEFREGLRLVDKYYTKSVKEKILSSVLHETSEKYYGNLFEVSSLYYNQALAFLKLYEQKQYKRWFDKGKELEKPIIETLDDEQAKQNLFSARASVVAWDSFFKEIQRGKEKTFFSEDPLNKLLAAKIHELVGTREDKQIALQLYKDAHRLLHTYGHTLKTYQDDFDNVAKEVMQAWDKKKKAKFPVQGTDQFKTLNQYIDKKIYQLTYQTRRSQLKRTVKQFNIETKDISKKANTTLLIEQGLIAPVEGYEYSYGLASAARNAKDPSTRALINGLGIPIITYFALGPLGLGTYQKIGRNSYIYSSHNVGTTMVGEVAIEFELPYVKPLKPLASQTLVIADKQSGAVVLEKKIPIISASSDIAFQLNKERSTGLFTKKGLRVALKHISAIIAAHGVYKSMGGDDNGLARFAAIGSYLGASKAIAASEKADTRHWTTLPSNISMVDVDLAKGNYTAKLKTVDGEKQSVVELGELVIGEAKQNLFTYNL